MLTRLHIILCMIPRRVCEMVCNTNKKLPRKDLKRWSTFLGSKLVVQISQNIFMSYFTLNGIKSITMGTNEEKMIFYCQLRANVWYQMRYKGIDCIFGRKSNILLLNLENLIAVLSRDQICKKTKIKLKDWLDEHQEKPNCDT